MAKQAKNSDNLASREASNNNLRMTPEEKTMVYDLLKNPNKVSELARYVIEQSKNIPDVQLFLAKRQSSIKLNFVHFHISEQFYKDEIKRVEIGEIKPFWTDKVQDSANYKNFVAIFSEIIRIATEYATGKNAPSDLGKNRFGIFFLDLQPEDKGLAQCEEATSVIQLDCLFAKNEMEYYIGVCRSEDALYADIAKEEDDEREMNEQIELSLKIPNPFRRPIFNLDWYE